MLAVAWLPCVFGGIQAWVFPPWRATAWSQVAELVFQAGVLALVLHLIWRGGSWGDVLGRPPRVLRDLLAGLALAVVPLVAAALALALAGEIYLPFEPRRTGLEDVAGWSRQLLPAALLEEVVYRAYLQDRLARLLGDPVLALLASSALFTAAHVASPFESVSIFLCGLLWGWAFLRTRSLTPVVLGHWLHNLVVLLG